MSGYRLFKYAESSHEYTVEPGHTHRASIEALRMPDGAGLNQRKLGWRSPGHPGLCSHVSQSAMSKKISARASPSTTLTRPRYPGPFPYRPSARDDSTSYHHARSRLKVVDTQFSMGILDSFIPFKHHMDRITGTQLAWDSQGNLRLSGPSRAGHDGLLSNQGGKRLKTA